MIHPNAEVESGCVIGSDTYVWNLAHIRSGSQIGTNCTVGRGAYIGPGVKCGDNCKIQNFALLYEPARLGDGVFIGPAVVLTNDLHPRAVSADGRVKSSQDWHAVGVEIADGASIGARSVCVAPVSIGTWAMVGAGSVVISDVPDYALVVGNPARQIGWVCRCGHRLSGKNDVFDCETCGRQYGLSSGRMSIYDGRVN